MLLGALLCEQPFGMLAFIAVCECGYDRQQLTVVKVVEVVVVVRNKYQLHFTIICTAARGPKRPRITAPLIAPLHSWRMNQMIKEMSVEIALNVWESQREVSNVNDALSHF